MHKLRSRVRCSSAGSADIAETRIQRSCAVLHPELAGSRAGRSDQRSEQMLLFGLPANIWLLCKRQMQHEAHAAKARDAEEEKLVEQKC